MLRPLSRGLFPAGAILGNHALSARQTLPRKARLHGQGEIGGCDLVALSGGDPPVVVIGELKLSFNLELILQAVDRAAAADEVWLAAKMSARGKGRESDARYRNLCRRLGFGMLGVTNNGDVEVLVKPPTTAPAAIPKSARGWSPSTSGARAIRCWAAARVPRS